MLVEVLRRVVHAWPLFVAYVAVLRLGKVEVRRRVGAVDVGQRLLLLGVVEEPPLPALGIGARRSLQRQIETLRQHLPRHRPLEIEPLAHRTRGGQDFIRGQVQGHFAETTFASWQSNSVKRFPSGSSPITTAGSRRWRSPASRCRGWCGSTSTAPT